MLAGTLSAEVAELAENLAACAPAGAAADSAALERSSAVVIAHLVAQ